MKSQTGFVHSLDESFHETLAPGALIVGVAFILVGISRLLGPPDPFEAQSALEIGVGLALLSLAFFCRNRRFSSLHAHWVGFMIVAPILFDTAIYYSFPRGAQSTFSLYATVIAASLIPFSRSWFIGITGLTTLVWCYAVARSTAPVTEWVPQASGMLTILALGAALHIWRIRFATHFDHLREEAVRADAARAQFESHYRQLTELSNDLITEIDESGRIVYANAAHHETTGYRPSQMVGYSVIQLLPDSVRFSDLFDQPPHKRILEVPRRQGGNRLVECNVRPYELTNGERRLLVTTRDMTERIASERALEAGHAQLEALVEKRTAALSSSLIELQRADRLASMGTMAAGIAHQINNPVGSIQMSAELALLSEGDEGERELWRDALKNCVDQAKRCGQIVSSMLQFARNEPTARADHDLAELVLRVCSQTESYAQSRRAVIHNDGIESPLPVFASAIEIEQALLNILHNATESSADSVQVHVIAQRFGDFAQITVSDNGGGMQPEEVEHAFDPFFTTRLERGGTGLGLSVAHGIIADHEGSLSIESKFGMGTTVVIRIPIREASEGSSVANS